MNITVDKDLYGEYARLIPEYKITFGARPHFSHIAEDALKQFVQVIEIGVRSQWAVAQMDFVLVNQQVFNTK